MPLAAESGELKKLGLSGGGNWKVGERSGYGDLGERLENTLGEGMPGDGKKPACS